MIPNQRANKPRHPLASLRARCILYSDDEVIMPKPSTYNDSNKIAQDIHEYACNNYLHHNIYFKTSLHHEPLPLASSWDVRRKVTLSGHHTLPQLSRWECSSVLPFVWSIRSQYRSVTNIVITGMRNGQNSTCLHGCLIHIAYQVSLNPVLGC